MINTALLSFQNSSGYPQNISELSQAQWVQYLMLLSRFTAGEISTKEFKIHWLAYLTRAESIAADSKREEEMLDSGNHILKGFIVKDEGDESFDTFSVINNLPQYTWNNRTYTGPQDMCYNLSFGRFITAYYVFQDYTLTQNKIALRYLFAVLYSDGSPLEERVDHLADIPEYAAISAYHFFKSVVKHISENSIYVAGEELPLYEVFEETGRRSYFSPFGIEEALYEMASEGGVNVERENLRNQNLFEVLRFIWFRMKSQ